MLVRRRRLQQRQQRERVRVSLLVCRLGFEQPHNAASGREPFIGHVLSLLGRDADHVKWAGPAPTRRYVGGMSPGSRGMRPSVSAAPIGEAPREAQTITPGGGAFTAFRLPRGRRVDRASRKGSLWTERLSRRRARAFRRRSWPYARMSEPAALRAAIGSTIRSTERIYGKPSLGLPGRTGALTNAPNAARVPGCGCAEKAATSRRHEPPPRGGHSYE